MNISLAITITPASVAVALTAATTVMPVATGRAASSRRAANPAVAAASAIPVTV